LEKLDALLRGLVVAGGTEDIERERELVARLRRTGDMDAFRKRFEGSFGFAELQ
jgi:hypothetical protein